VGIYLRRTKTEELDKVMAIIEDAKKYLAQQQSPQWQNGYGPTKEMIMADIERKESYVLILDDRIVGTAALVSGTDPVYENIDGAWKECETRYLSIHRVALDQTIRGKKLAKQLLEHLQTITAYQGIKDLRIDTFPENKPMEGAIFTAGFAYQGMVHFPIPHGERKAYQKIV
jgi:GNAT superfamily N-acetyltransferase